MSEPDREVLRTAIFKIIENQINGNIPPQTKETYNRLMAEGYSKEEAMKLIGCVVASEIFGVLKEGRTYNEAAYIRALEALPQLPWEGETNDCTNTSPNRTPVYYAALRGMFRGGAG